MSLADKLNKAAKHFEKGGKYERWFPLFEITDTFLYTPANVTTGKTHVRDAIDLKRLMSVVVLALMPVMFTAIYNTGYQANLAISLNDIHPTDWRYLLMNAIGLKNDPNAFASNMFLGFLFFFPLFLMTQIVGGFGNYSLPLSENTKSVKVFW